MPISGGWALRSRTPPTVPLNPPPDPEHLNPTDDQSDAARWQSNVAAPLLPNDMYPDAPVMLTQGGPVDQTPEDHNYGMGVGPGLTLAESQARSGQWHEQDLGTYFAESWVPAVDRDGAPHLAVIEDTPGQGDSPATLQLQRTGVGQPNDPNARIGKRRKRWYDRYIEMHRYDATMQPDQQRYARPVPSRGAVQGGSSSVSPFANNTAGPIGTVDTFVGATVRRPPGASDQLMVTDGSGTISNDYGLTVF